MWVCTKAGHLRPVESSGMMASGGASHWYNVAHLPIYSGGSLGTLQNQEKRTSRHQAPELPDGDATEGAGRRQTRVLKAKCLSCWGMELAGRNDPDITRYKRPISVFSGQVYLPKTGASPDLRQLGQNVTTSFPQPCGGHWKISYRCWDVQILFEN